VTHSCLTMNSDSKRPRDAKGSPAKLALLLAVLSLLAVGFAGAYLGGSPSSWGHRIATNAALAKEKFLQVLTDEGRGGDETGSIDRNSDGYVEEVERILDTEYPPAVDRGMPGPRRDR